MDTEFEVRRLFDSDGRPLYGVLHRGRDGAPLVLFCNAFSENHWEWRAEVIAARIMAARGYSTFCYHPRAHGDSAGDLQDVSFEDLLIDAANAAAYARAQCDTSRIVWVGIRFGALVVAHTIRAVGGLAGLALWEPVHRARDYFLKSMRHVMYYEMSQGERPSTTTAEMSARLEREGRVPLLSFDLYRRFSITADEVHLLEALQSLRAPTMIAQFQNHSRLSRENRKLCRSLARRGVNVRYVLNRGQTGSDPWWSPEGVAQQMADWLDELG